MKKCRCLLYTTRMNSAAMVFYLSTPCSPCSSLCSHCPHWPAVLPLSRSLYRSSSREQDGSFRRLLFFSGIRSNFTERRYCKIMSFCPMRNANALGLREMLPLLRNMQPALHPYEKITPQTFADCRFWPHY